MRLFTDQLMKIFELETISCHDVHSLYGDYYDGDLPECLGQRIKEHIEDCTDCKEFENSYRFTLNAARELRDREVPMPNDVKNRLRKALNERLGLSMPMVG